MSPHTEPCHWNVAQGSAGGLITYLLCHEKLKNCPFVEGMPLKLLHIFSSDVFVSFLVLFNLSDRAQFFSVVCKTVRKYIDIFCQRGLTTFTSI